MLHICFEKILTQLPNKHKNLRSKIEDVVKDLEEVSSETEVKGDPYWPLLKEVLESNLRVREAALDGLQKLIAHGLFSSEAKSEEAEPLKDNNQLSESTLNLGPLTLSDEIIITVCSMSEPEDSLQLQIMRFLLTAHACFQVHGKTLIRSFQTCFSIYLRSENMINQVTAKAALTQICTGVFKKMDVIKVTEEPERFENPRDPPGKYGYCLVCKNPANHFCGDAIEPVCSIACKQKNLKALGKEKASKSTSNLPLTIVNPIDKLSKYHAESFQQYHAVLTRDCKLVFRFLCRVSVKFDSDEPHKVTLRGRSLALEMILSVLQTINFQSDEFVHLLRKNLCISLSKNGVNSNANLFELSLQIFSHLVFKYRSKLLGEIEILFKEIFLKILEMANSFLQQKILVLNFLLKVFSDPQTLCDLFANYDLEMESSGIYEMMLKQVLRICSMIDSDFQCKVLGLRCLVSNLCSLDSFSVVEFSEQRLEETVERVVSTKQKLGHGIQLFNTNPQKGIEYLIEHGIVEGEAESIANFFISNKELSKKSIGIYFGESKDLNIKVMHSFIDSLNLPNEFLPALRFFLQQFRPQGESQKIDRILEKFADRFTELHPTVFNGNADIPYTLAYSTMMLNTDLHSNQVRNKMEKESFIRMNREILDIEENILSSVFDDILKNEILLEEEHVALVASLVPHSEAEKREYYKMETNFMKKKSEIMFKSKRETFFKKAEVYLVRHMFLLCLDSSVDQFIAMFGNSDSKEVDELCRKGLMETLKLINAFGLSGQNVVFKLFDSKHFKESDVLAVSVCKFVIEIGQLYGDCIDEAWICFTRALSQLEKSNQLDDRLVQLVDLVFTSSFGLKSTSITSLFKALVETGCADLEEGNRYIVSKIVEIAYYNMRRIRLEWTLIWKVLAPFFNKIGTGADAEFAVDSLRQLCLKFLDRDELIHFQFQNDFMRPFEYIMRNGKEEIQVLILDSISQLVEARSQNIKSGWKSIFCVITKACPLRLTESFSLLQSIYSKCFDSVLVHAFVDFVSCVTEFCLVSDEEIVKSSMEILHSSTRNFELDQDSFFLKWFPCLSAYSRIILESNSQTLRTKTVDILFAVIKQVNSYWHPIYRSILSPILEDLRSSVVLYIQITRLLIDLYSAHSVYLNVVCEMIKRMCESGNENLNMTCGVCLHQLVVKNQSKFDENEWKQVLELVIGLLRTSFPDYVENLENSPVTPQSVEGSSSQQSSIHASILQVMTDTDFSLIDEFILLDFYSFLTETTEKWTSLNKNYNLKQKIGDLTKQETLSYSLLLRVQFALHKDYKKTCFVIFDCANRNGWASLVEFAVKLVQDEFDLDVYLRICKLCLSTSDQVRKAAVEYLEHMGKTFAVKLTEDK